MIILVESDEIFVEAGGENGDEIVLILGRLGLA